MTDVITMSSSSDDDRPPIARGGEASSSSSDGDAGFNGDVLATELAKMPLALRAQLTAAAKSSTSTNQRTLVSEWSEKTDEVTRLDTELKEVVGKLEQLQKENKSNRTFESNTEEESTARAFRWRTELKTSTSFHNVRLQMSTEF